MSSSRRKSNDQSGYGHDSCSPDLVCALPKLTAPPVRCTTKALTSDPGGLEGRCVPRCLLSGNPLVPLLEEFNPSCKVGSVCAPCYNPADGTSTGVCTMDFAGAGHDTPTMPAPAPYASRPEGDAGGPYTGGGLCVPEAMVMNHSNPNNPLYNPLVADLKQDSCAMGEKCVPKAKAEDPRHCAAPCKTAQALANLGYPDGACMAAYAAFDANGPVGVTIFRGQAGATAACGQDELCYPCSDPLCPGHPTGACF